LSQDLTEDGACARVRKFLEDQYLYTDILVNCAGFGTTGDIVDQPADRLSALTRLNVTALTDLSREFLPDMLIRGRGGIINLASMGGFAPGPYQAGYYASKAYVISLTRAIAHETRGKGVRITAVAPGPVNTQFHARADGDTALYSRILPNLSPAQVARSTRRGYDWGHGLIVPGVFNTITAVFMRLLPAAMTAPIIAILLKPRRSPPG
ncbi:MAG: SDR family NAD(P)-dependent oxidoreductase, partial [Alphaproteobacteria bacterium]|nr:SDR family NAD(P)-dependent oxidoreductase [Alphaproteobacteria bacterium]